MIVGDGGQCIQVNTSGTFDQHSQIGGIGELLHLDWKGLPFRSSSSQEDLNLPDLLGF